MQGAGCRVLGAGSRVQGADQFCVATLLFVADVSSELPNLDLINFTIRSEGVCAQREAHQVVG